MKRIFLCVAIVALVMGCAAPPAGETVAEPDTAAASQGQETARGDEEVLPNEGFDAGETGELDQQEKPPNDED